MRKSTGKRKYKAVIDEEKIARRLEQSAVGDTLYVKTSISATPVALKGYVNRLSVRFYSDKKIKAEKLRIFWSADQHIEFEGIVNCGEKLEDKRFEYGIRVIRMLIPETNRLDKRYRADSGVFTLGSISYSSVHEDSNSIAKVPEYEEYLRDMRDSLDNFAFVGVYSLNSSAAPSEIQFSQFTNSILFIRNLSSYKIYLNKNEYFFENIPRMKEHLENRLKTLNLRYSSLIVRPIDYLPMVGKQFPIAHIVAAKENSEIQNEDILAIDEAAHRLYNRLTNDFYKKINCRGSLDNISISGARIYIEENKFYEELSKIDTLSFVLRIVGLADIQVSGEINYIQRTNKGFYLGVQFKRSAFGSRFPRFLFETIKSHNLPAV